MTIQPLTGRHNVVSPSKSTPNEKVQSTDVQTTRKENDNVDITTVAQKITEAFESSKTTLAIDEKHVSEVKKAIMEGTYPINAEEIARKMIEMEPESNINSR